MSRSRRRPRSRSGWRPGAGSAQVPQGGGCGEGDRGAVAVTAMVAVDAHRLREAGRSRPGRPDRDRRDRVVLAVISHQAASLSVCRRPATSRPSRSAVNVERSKAARCIVTRSATRSGPTTSTRAARGVQGGRSDRGPTVSTGRHRSSHADEAVNERPHRNGPRRPLCRQSATPRVGSSRSRTSACASSSSWSADGVTPIRIRDAWSRNPIATTVFLRGPDS